MKKIAAIIGCLFVLTATAQQTTPLLKIAANKRYFVTADNKPFFWLGDTGWLLFVKMTREETLQYLDKRQAQGYNVIQVMVLHSLGNAVNRYGDSALVNQDIAQPNLTPGADVNDTAQYDFWDHVDFVIKEAGKRNIYMALVPLWGSNVKNKKVTTASASVYAKFLADRYKTYNNIIWLNGGDIPGNEGMEIWKAIGTVIKKNDTRHLVTYHPRGRYSSSEWFHQEPWLDFNMFQSGHRNYAQDTSIKEKNHFGEDNWRYVQADYQLQPVKPTIDGEPSYENIPYGLHDSLQPRWKDADLRRYGYWSVLAGGAGFTYGENAIMQFHRIDEGAGSFGVTMNWQEGLEAPGAAQMQYLKQLMLSKSWEDRSPAQDVILDNTGEKYNYILATKGKKYILAYTYTGKPIKVKLGTTQGKKVTASWYDPRTGKYNTEGTYDNRGVKEFDPPGEEQEGNDWVLVLESN